MESQSLKLRVRSVLGFLSCASLTPKDEWLSEFTPGQLTSLDLQGIDLFTFWQLFPDVEPHYDYFCELDNIAIVETISYGDWWNRIDSATRAMVRKSKKLGVEVREAQLDESYVRGITDIFNETPYRQGRRYRRYGSAFEDVKRSFESDSPEDIHLGAYFKGEVIGMAHIMRGERFSFISTIQAYERHFDKGVMNALIAQAIESCARHGIRYLAYEKMTYDGLGAFKRHNGFEKHLVPRYYVPLTWNGKLALALHLHKGLRGLIPVGVKRFAKMCIKRMSVHNPFRKMRKLSMAVKKGGS